MKSSLESSMIRDVGSTAEARARNSGSRRPQKIASTQKPSGRPRASRKKTDAKREPDRAKPKDAKREPDRAKPKDAKREPDRAKPKESLNNRSRPNTRVVAANMLQQAQGRYMAKK